LRFGELLGLDVPHVDFLRRTIRVERQRSQSGELTPPKPKSSARTVPVGQTVIDALAAYLEAEERHTGPPFVNALGRPLTYRQWKPLWKTGAEAARAEATAHSLRHFYASALIFGGASVKAAQTVLGHASAVVTLRTNAHLWPGDGDRTRSIIDAVFSVSADQVRTKGVL
jgi:integrase